MRTVRLGGGAGFGGDRIDPAVDLARQGQLDYLVFECLAERTIALHQQERLLNSERGYSPGLERRLGAVLEPCLEQGTIIITNMGAANPLAAASRVVELLKRQGMHGVRVAAVTGDDVLPLLAGLEATVLETGETLSGYRSRLISANAYLGAEALVTALQHCAQIIVTGRVADPSLFLAPLVHEFGWSWEDYDRLGRGSIVGHLLECGGQVSGGYFADYPLKPVPKLWELGFPLAEVGEDGNAVITKLPGTGGMVTAATCAEQLLYEIHDPGAYITPDVVVDLSEVELAAVGPDRVLVSGGRGRMRPEQLKVSLGYRDSFVGEGEIGYAGPGAEARAALAAEIVKRRLQHLGAIFQDLRFDRVGVDSLHGTGLAQRAAVPYEVRLRAVGRAVDWETAALIGEEVEALWTNGPAGGGGARRSVREVIGIVSILLPRQMVQPQVVMLTS